MQLGIFRPNDHADVNDRPDKVDLGLRELKDPLDSWQKSTIHQ